MITAAFLVTTLLVVLTPGIGVVYTINAGIAGGRRAGTIAAIGCMLGIVPHLAAALLGLSAVLDASAQLFTLLKVAGVGLMLYLAWTTWRDRSAIPVSNAVPIPAGRLVGRAILANLLNPKLTAFFFAFLPPFIARDAPDATAQLLELSLVFMAVTLVVFVAYGWFAAAARELLTARPDLLRRLRQGFAAAYLVLATRLATTDR